MQSVSRYGSKGHHCLDGGITLKAIKPREGSGYFIWLFAG